MLAGSELQVLGVCGGAACWEHLGASVRMAAGGIRELTETREMLESAPGRKHPGCTQRETYHCLGTVEGRSNCLSGYLNANYLWHLKAVNDHKQQRFVDKYRPGSTLLLMSQRASSPRDTSMFGGGQGRGVWLVQTEPESEVPYPLLNNRHWRWSLAVFRKGCLAKWSLNARCRWEMLFGHVSLD